MASQIDYRQLNVIVAHPRDQDGDLLLRHLNRLGCPVLHLWPAPDRVEQAVDIAFCLVDTDTRALCASLTEASQAAVVGIIDPGNPRAMQVLADIGPQAVVTKPLDPAAILTNLVVARNNSRYQKRLHTKISKLEETLKSVRKVERAKSILMERRHIDESEAYAYLREQAMKRRVPIGAIASVVVDSDEVLAGDKD